MYCSGAQPASTLAPILPPRTYALIIQCRLLVMPQHRPHPSPLLMQDLLTVTPWEETDSGGAAESMTLREWVTKGFRAAKAARPPIEGRLLPAATIFQQ